MEYKKLKDNLLNGPFIFLLGLKGFCFYFFFWTFLDYECFWVFRGMKSGECGFM